MRYSVAMTIAIGKFAKWASDRYLLVLAILVATATATVLSTAPFARYDDKSLRGWALSAVIACVVLVPVCAALEKFADKFGKRRQTSAGVRATVAIARLLEEAELIALSEKPTSTKLLTRFPHSVAQACVNASAEQAKVRATYYPLTYDDAYRVLRKPVNKGRPDAARTVFRERDDPGHPIWKLMDEQDENCEVVRRSTSPDLIDWSSKPYKCFCSVPVRTAGLTFGMLSINSTDDRGLTELDRMTTLSIARIAASVMALSTGPRTLKAQASEQADCHAATRITDSPEPPGE